MKKIGEYLIENNICDESSLKDALEEQTALREKGVLKPVGSVLAESGNIKSQDLGKVLERMHRDILSSSAMSKDLSAESIKETVSLAEHKIMSDKEVIFSKGDQPDSFYIITSGEVNISISSSDDSGSLLAVLNKGDGFGEVALLTGEPHTKTATASGPTSLLVLSKKFFNKFCALNLEVSMAFIRGLANRLMQKDAEIVKANKKERAYQQFVSEQDTLSLPELIGRPGR